METRPILLIKWIYITQTLNFQRTPPSNAAATVKSKKAHKSDISTLSTMVTTRRSTKKRRRRSKRLNRKHQRRALPAPAPRPDAIKLPRNNGIPSFSSLNQCFFDEKSAIDYLVQKEVLKVPLCPSCGLTMQPKGANPPINDGAL